jgi:hypothetical protein
MNTQKTQIVENQVVTQDRIAKNACNVYLKQMQGGKLMGCAQPKKIANKMYIYLGVKCDYDECFVWISNHVSQQKLF